MKKGERWGLRIGGVIFGLGLLLIAFVAYQLWGTGIYESQAQDHLRSDLSTALHRAVPGSADPNSGTNSGSPDADKLPKLASHIAPSTPDPAINSAVGLLSIPKIGLNDAIVEGVGEGELQQGPGHYPGTPMPGQAGNVAIAGHRTTYAHPFYNLNELAPGDPIYILTDQGLFRYKVTGTQIVPPTDTAVLTSASNAPTLTLTTCNPRYSAATRMVVSASFDPGTSTDIGVGSTQTPVSAPAKGNAPVATIPGDSLSGSSNGYWPALLLSLLTILVAALVWIIWRRSPRKFRWLVVLIGVPAFLACLLISFEHISLALPGSF